MMHYGPWIHHQGVMDNRYYSPYIMDVYSHRHQNIERNNLMEEDGDETHDTITSATSGDQSSSADIFRLEFAAAQWSKLVSNAEGLFNKLITSNLLSDNEQDQIEQWLCMKQEYEECIASDDTASLQGFAENTRRSLERIEEVTETDEKTDESASHIDRNLDSKNHCDMNSESSDVEDDDDGDDDDEDEDEHSDASSDNPDFLEKLDECIRKFKTETDKIVDSMTDNFSECNSNTTPSKVLNTNNNHTQSVKPTSLRNNNFRRNSMLPGSEMCNVALAFNDNLKPNQKQLNDNITDNCREILDNCRFDSPDILMDTMKTDTPEPIRELKNLTLNNEVKHTQVKKIQFDLDDANKRIEELQTTIKIKERFIADMIKNSDTRTTAQQKFQRKLTKLEEEYYNTKTQLAQAENASLCKNSDEKSSPSKEIELYKNMAMHYEKRLMDIDMIKQIAGDSAKKVVELESSLNSSKKQMEKLKKLLKKEEERKKQLEEELAEDQKKIRELEEKYNLTASKLKEMQSESEDERNGKCKINESNKKNLLDVSARISHLDHVLKEKSMDLEKTADIDEKEALRHEIRNLRRTRDCLIDEKCDLDEKFQKERTLTTVEERKLLECGETIEAIDAMIEHKNEMICGRKGIFDENQSQREKGERMLMERLSKLSDGEMRTLFYKYFLKVIDLKESSKNLEIQNAELEARAESQEWRIQTLTNALKQTKLEAERHIVLMQREHENKVNLMLRHFTEETSSSGHERMDMDSELVKYKRENRSLKRRLADVEALLKGIPRATSPTRIPQQGLKQITPNTRPTTKVTRQRNKLIIQKTTDSDRKRK